MEDHVYQVAVVGAGIAGLSAVEILVKNGIRDFVIIEVHIKRGSEFNGFFEKLVLVTL